MSRQLIQAITIDIHGSREQARKYSFSFMLTSGLDHALGTTLTITTDNHPRPQLGACGTHAGHPAGC